MEGAAVNDERSIINGDMTINEEPNCPVCDAPADPIGFPDENGPTPFVCPECGCQFTEMVSWD